MWNAVASLLNTGQSILLLMVISRIDPVSDAGIFTIGYAVANLMVMVGRYGIRQFQSSDLKEVYSFKEYNTTRIVSCIAMLIACGGYVLFCCLTETYTVYKGCSVFLICLARMIDAYEDVIHGFFQQHGYLETASKIQTIRFIAYMIMFGTTYLITENLIYAGTFGVAVSLLFAVFLNGIAYKNLKISPGRIRKKNIWKLFQEGFPLFVSVFLSTYLGNAPKYAIDKVLSDEIQAQFNYIFMPVFVITLLSMFIYQPMVVRYANYWMEKELTDFVKEIKKQSVFLGGLEGIALVAAFILGIPVLSMVFAVDLSGYRFELLVLIIGGGMLAYVNYFTMIITIMRAQKVLFAGYIVAAAVFFLCSKMVVRMLGIPGLCVLYAVTMFLLAFYCLIIISWKIRCVRNSLIQI